LINTVYIAVSVARHELKVTATVTINILSAAPLRICVRIHLKSRISPRYLLRSIGFYFAWILREITPTQHRNERRAQLSRVK